MSFFCERMSQILLVEDGSNPLSFFKSQSSFLIGKKVVPRSKLHSSFYDEWGFLFFWGKGAERRKNKAQFLIVG
jgi:hypothetical protein